MRRSSCNVGLVVAVINYKNIGTDFMVEAGGNTRRNPLYATANKRRKMAERTSSSLREGNPVDVIKEHNRVDYESMSKLSFLISVLRDEKDLSTYFSGVL